MIRSTLRSPLRLAAIALVGILAAACIPLNADEQTLFDGANDLRNDHGRRALLQEDNLVEYARAWAATLAREGSLRHSDLSTVPVGWSKIAENIGRGSSAESIQRSWESSPRHRANILDADFTHVGVGTAVGADGRVYAVEVFIRP